MRLTVSALQSAGVPGDVAANLDELDRAAATAAADGADLLVTPELFVTGYNIGDRVRELAAVGLDERVADIARRHHIGLVVGAAERDDRDGLHNSAFLVSEEGELLARHRKAHLFGDLDRGRFEPGPDPVTLASYRGLGVALLICYDVEFPESVRAAALAGAQAVLVPTAQMEPFEFVAEQVIRARAWENQVYVVYANRTGREGDLAYVGRSSIVDPYARVLDSRVDGPGLLSAEIDTDVVAQAQRDNPYLTDLRTELFSAGPEATDPPGADR
jgi:predicted amidohydrolase